MVMTVASFVGHDLKREAEGHHKNIGLQAGSRAQNLPPTPIGDRRRAVSHSTISPDDLAHYTKYIPRPARRVARFPQVRQHDDPRPSSWLFVVLSPQLFPFPLPVVPRPPQADGPQLVSQRSTCLP
jgi:hypothetical protein